MKTVESKVDDKLDELDEKALEEGLKSTKALVQSFLQTLKGFRLYEPNHQILIKFQDRLKNDFDRYFKEYNSFSLQVGEHRLFYHGKVVYESQDIKESLAFIFFKDGIRELRFHKGLEFKEILDFLEVVRKSDLVNRMEDDLVTLLWEKDFSHISFATIEEFLEKGTTFVPATEQELNKGLEFKGSDEWLFGQPEEPKPETLPVITDEGLKQAINPLPGQSVVQACQLTSEEIEGITQEIDLEQQSEHLVVLINSLIEILLHLGEDMDAYENMISYFERILEGLLDQGEIGKAVVILNSLKDTMESMVLKDKQIFAIRRILETSSAAKSIELLGKVIQGNGEMNSDSVLKYFSFLTNQAIHPLCALLGQLSESPKWKKTVCDQLSRLCAQDFQPLIKYLSDRNTFLVCSILSVLGKIGHPSTVKSLASLVSHHDLKVRMETLHLLTKFGDRGRDLIPKFLRDPDMEIRARASLLLARTAKGQAVKPLTDIILSDDFYKREYEEKISFFKALGETGSKEVVPILKKIAGKRAWFKGAKWDEMRTCASNTLRMIGAEK